jgi:hypothetical protein
MSAIAEGHGGGGGGGRGPDGEQERRVAVVGGGVAGLFCAATLSEFGYNVSLFDMGKTSVGGRGRGRDVQSWCGRLLARQPLRLHLWRRVAGHPAPDGGSAAGGPARRTGGALLLRPRRAPAPRPLGTRARRPRDDAPHRVAGAPV